MNDALTRFIANNLILTAIILAVIFMGFRTGLGAARKLVFLIVLVVVAPMLMQSCGQYVSSPWTGSNPGVATALPTGAGTSGAPGTTSGASLAQCRPSSTWTAADESPEPSGLHGPYASVNEAVLRDRASALAFYSTRLNPIEGEYGFLIERDTRPAGGYYTTPPVAAPPKVDATGRPRFRREDYIASEDKAFGSCDYHKYFMPVATVHTHPNVRYLSDTFTADDFDQAILFKQMFPATWEEIVMINARDQKIRTFTPRVNDQVIGSLLGEYYLNWVVGLLPIVDVNWSLYAALRVDEIGHFEAPPQ